MSKIPSDFTRTTTEVHGEAGTEWLGRLPGLLAECAKRWGLIVGPPFTPLTYNYVAPAVRADGSPVVLKAGVPSDGMTSEIEALRIFAGRGSVQLLEADLESGVFVLERLVPGTALLRLADDAEAAKIAAKAMKRLWQPAPTDQAFTTVGYWMQGLKRLRTHFGGGMGPLPRRLVEEAEALSHDLLASAEQSTLLHGDLHHDNILADSEDWLAIDPKGVLGEPSFEPSAFLLNPSPQSASVLDRRVDIFAGELGLPRERILGWGMARAVLSAWWTVEDHGTGWEGAIAVAERLSSLRA